MSLGGDSSSPRRRMPRPGASGRAPSACPMSTLVDLERELLAAQHERRGARRAGAARRGAPAPPRGDRRRVGGEVEAEQVLPGPRARASRRGRSGRTASLDLVAVGGVRLEYPAAALGAHPARTPRPRWRPRPWWCETASEVASLRTMRGSQRRRVSACARRTRRRSSTPPLAKADRSRTELLQRPCARAAPRGGAGAPAGAARQCGAVAIAAARASARSRPARVTSFVAAKP